MLRLRVVKFTQARIVRILQNRASELLIIGRSDFSVKFYQTNWNFFIAEYLKRSVFFLIRNGLYESFAHLNRNFIDMKRALSRKITRLTAFFNNKISRLDFSLLRNGPISGAKNG